MLMPPHAGVAGGMGSGLSMAALWRGAPGTTWGMPWSRGVRGLSGSDSKVGTMEGNIWALGVFTRRVSAGPGIAIGAEMALGL